MNDILKKLNFITLNIFIKTNLNINVICPDIFIRCDNKIPKFNLSSNFSNISILKKVLEINSNNVLNSGFDFYQKIWKFPNTTRNLLKSKKWENIFKSVGNDFSLFILTKCLVVEFVNKKLIFISGDFFKLNKFSKSDKISSRNKLFISKKEINHLNYDQLINTIFSNVNLKKNTEILLVFEKVCKKFNKLNIKAIFKEYFSKNKEKKEIESIRIINFLFMISKKFLSPIFNFNNFKILKGKITLLIKRNIYESLNKEELKNFFKIKKLNLFNLVVKIKREDNKEEYNKIIKNLNLLFLNFLRFLFKNIYLKITSFFFYTTTISTKKHKLVFYIRNDFNKEANFYIKKYLKNFSAVNKKGIYGSIRCVMKKDDFRIISNCSKKTFDNKISINNSAVHLLPILRNEVIKNNENGLMGFKDFEKKMLNFYNSDKNRFKNFYLIKLDILKCFDNIPHKNLLEIIDDNFNDNYYNYSEYKYLEIKNDNLCYKTLKKSFKYILPVKDLNEKYFLDKNIFNYEMIKNKIDFNKNFNNNSNPNSFSSKAEELNRNIIIKENKHKIIFQKDLKNEIKKGINEVLIKYRKKYYKSNKGILQGFTLSPMLCFLYLSKILKNLNIDKKVFLIYYYDDILLISEDLIKINKVYDNINNLKEKGLILNKKKVVKKLKIDNLDFIKFCGYKIFNRGYSIKIFIDNEDFRYTVILPYSNQGKKIFEKTIKSFQNKFSYLLINKKNKKLGENIYDILYLTVRKIKILFLRAEFININFIKSLLNFLVKFLIEILKKRKIKFDNLKVEKIAKEIFEKLKIFEIKKLKIK